MGGAEPPLPCPFADGRDPIPMGRDFRVTVSKRTSSFSVHMLRYVFWGHFEAPAVHLGTWQH